MRSVLIVGLFVTGAFAGCSSSGNEDLLQGSGGSSAHGGSGAMSAGGFGGTAASSSGGSAGTLVGVGGSSATGAGGSGADAGCATSTAKADALPPILMLVIDTSGSMGDAAPGGGGTKLQVTKQALIAAINGGNGSSGMTDGNQIGMYFYPGTQGLFGSCINKTVAVPIAALGPTGGPQRTTVQTSLQGATALGGTPTHDAYMVGLQTANAYPGAGNKFVVLITDGIPTYALNCNGNGSTPVNQAQADALVNQVQNAATGGIRTFIIGSPGSELTRNTLSRMATAGGTAQPGCSDTGPSYCHFDMTTSSNLALALNDALAKISGTAALSCTYPVPAPPNGEQLNPDKVNVSFTPGGGQPQEIFKDGSNTCTQGWRYTDPVKRDVIEICGTDCDMVKADTHGQLDLQFGCDSHVH